MPLPIGYRIRPYAPGDLPALLAITEAGFGPASIDKLIDDELPGLLPTDWVARKLAAVREDCRIEPEGVLVAVDGDDAVVGYVTSRRNAGTSIGWIPNLAVSEARRRQGIARELLTAAIDRLRAGGMRAAKIETLAHNAAGQALYPSLGFREVARQIHYIAPILQPEGVDSC